MQQRLGSHFVHAIRAALVAISIGSAILPTSTRASPPDVTEMATLFVEPAAAKAAGNPDASATERLAQERSVDAVDTASNYAFFSSLGASLNDMSSGTALLLDADLDDSASALTPIGFDFLFQGARYTQFSVNTNGVLRLGGVAQPAAPYLPLGQASLPVITAYGADQRTHAGDGKVHYKLTGTAPNRTLVIEWLNMQSNFNAGGTADLTYQVILAENGTIGFIYGAMSMSAAGAADVNSQSPHIGFSSSNTAGTVGSVTAAQIGFPAPTFDGASATAAANTYTAGTIAALSSASPNARRFFLFTPPTPNPPTGLNITGTTAVSMLLNWADSSNELGYAVYRSTDGVNFAFDTLLAQNTTAYAVSGLAPSTTYTWRVFAISEGKFSTAIEGSKTTNAVGTIASNPGGGLWSAPATWQGGVVPGSSDAVSITSNVTIDTPAFAYAVTIQNAGLLQFEATTARTLIVGSTVTVNTTGILRSATTGTQKGHLVQVSGGFLNQGSVDFSTNGNTAGATLSFAGPAAATFTLSVGSFTNFMTGGVTLSKSTSTTLVNFTPGGTLTVQGSNATGFLKTSSYTGIFHVVGSTAFSNPLFDVAAWTIPMTGGLWMENASATVTAQAGTGTVAGSLQMSSGTLNVGTAIDQSLAMAAGSVVNIQGGAINVAGRVSVVAAANAITYSQTSGTVTTCKLGSTSTALACFDLGTGFNTSTISISGGVIVIQLASTAATGPRDYRNQAGTGTPLVTGGTLQLGNGSSGAAKSFGIAGVLPDLVIDNTSAGHTATFLTPNTFSNLARNVTIKAGSTLDIGNLTFLMNGTIFQNDGTLVASGANSLFSWFRNGVPLLYAGSGSVTAPMTRMAFQSDGGVTFSASSPPITVLNLVLFSGNVTNADRIILGNGGATNSAVQIGNPGSPSPAGNFDVPFTFNLGSGGQSLVYSRTTAARTIGPELNTLGILTSLTYDDNDPAHTLTLPAGDMLLTSAGTALNMVNGRVVGGGSSLTLANPTGAVTRTNGYFDGKLIKTFGAAGTKSFEVGTSNGYSPVSVNITVATFPTTFEVQAFETPLPVLGTTPLALKRYWYLNSSNGTTADLTFTYLDPTDIPATVNEGSLVAINQNGSVFKPAGTLNTANNTMTVTGQTSLAAWTLAVPINLLIVKSHGGGTLAQGQAGVPYTLTVTNSATPVPDGTKVTVTDALPFGLSYVSATGSGWTCGAVAQVVTCTITQTGGQPFAANASSAITLTVNVTGNAPASVTNTANCTCSVDFDGNNSWSDMASVNPTQGGGLSLTVTRKGSGSGTVTDSANGISCGSFCTNSYAAGTTVTLTATPTGGSTFMGWQGACSGTGTCVVTINAATAVSATFASAAAVLNKPLDADGNNAYDALTDGLLILRRLFGLNGSALIANAVAVNATRSDAISIADYIDDIGPKLDIDANGTTDALTDGLMIIRYLFGLAPDVVISNAVAGNATRTTAAAIKTYLDTLKP